MVYSNPTTRQHKNIPVSLLSAPSTDTTNGVKDAWKASTAKVYFNVSSLAATSTKETGLNTLGGASVSVTWTSIHL